MRGRLYSDSGPSRFAFAATLADTAHFRHANLQNRHAKREKRHANPKKRHAKP